MSYFGCLLFEWNNGFESSEYVCNNMCIKRLLQRIMRLIRRKTRFTYLLHCTAPDVLKYTSNYTVPHRKPKQTYHINDDGLLHCQHLYYLLQCILQASFLAILRYTISTFLTCPYRTVPRNIPRVSLCHFVLSSLQTPKHQLYFTKRQSRALYLQRSIFLLFPL